MTTPIDHMICQLYSLFLALVQYRIFESLSIMQKHKATIKRERKEGSPKSILGSSAGCLEISIDIRVLLCFLNDCPCF